MRLRGDSDFKSEGGMRKRAMGLQSLLGSDHNGRTTADGRRQSKEQHEGVSGPCTMTKANGREDGSHVYSAVKSKRNEIVLIN